MPGVAGGMMPSPRSAHLTDSLRELVLVEALESFAWSVRRELPRAQLSSLLAQLWRVPPERSPT